MQTFQLPVLVLLMMALASCSREINIHVPSQVNAPLLKDKKEFKGSITPNNLQAAYAVTNKFAVMASGQYVWRTGMYNRDSSGYKDKIGGGLVDAFTRGGQVEGAIGYFNTFHQRKALYDVFIGYGSGRFKSIDNEWSRDSSYADHQLGTRFRKFFIQPSFGLSHKVVELAFSTRFSLIHFHSTTLGVHALADSPEERAHFQTIDGRTLSFIEPAFTLRLGYRYVKWHSQIMLSAPIKSGILNGNDKVDHNMYFQPIAITMGVSLNFGQWVTDGRKR